MFKNSEKFQSEIEDLKDQKEEEMDEVKELKFEIVDLKKQNHSSKEEIKELKNEHMELEARFKALEAQFLKNSKMWRPYVDFDLFKWDKQPPPQ